MRRGALWTLIALVSILVASYVLYTQRVVSQLREDAVREARLYAQVFRAVNDTTGEDQTTTFAAMLQHIVDAGVPIVVTDASGQPTAQANLPGNPAIDAPAVRDWIARLDLVNPPVPEPSGGAIHIGNTPLVRGLRVIPLVQAFLLALLLATGWYLLRERGRAERERVWAGMARESAHQLGTPLSSLSGWIELLSERSGDEMHQRALDHMRTDLVRLDRVAHRFERIGRDARREEVDLAAVVDRVAAYYRARVPSMARTIDIQTEIPQRPYSIQSDPVLLEWALEALVKNAIDALTDTGGVIRMSVARLPEGATRLSVADDGPGVPRELRHKIFEAGFSTKKSGWGIGLSLARRIATSVPGGKLQLAPSDRGATFEIILPA